MRFTAVYVVHEQRQGIIGPNTKLSLEHLFVPLKLHDVPEDF